MKSSALAAVVAFSLTLGAIGWAHREERARVAGAFTLFSAQRRGCPIVVPRDAIAAEWRAARLLQATLAKASANPPARFPVLTEGALLPSGAVFVGRTHRSAEFLRAPPTPPFDVAVGFRASADAVVLCSEARDSALVAAAWFLEQEIGARWFMPGPLGEVVPVRPELKLPPTERIARPGFVSRDLGGVERGDDGVWRGQNRLERRLEQGHSLARIFTPEDLRHAPELAPQRNGQKYFPPQGAENWQPNLLAPAAVAHAATAAERAFREDAARISFSLCENDSDRFDDSPATLALVAPPRDFQGLPDYSDLVFGFTNAVAKRVAATYPDRWLTAYAYRRSANVPRFPVARNVVPIVATDRSQWFDAAVADADRDLLRRWCASGSRLVGVYDYFYGAPYLIPRPAVAAITASIPFEFTTGVRSYYAEINPHWSLDGPKSWLIAQLLWSPQADPQQLLDVYYREFWREAAGPMREFFEQCDAAWQNQPKPGYWIKYFQDEHQHLLFPAPRRAALRARLEQARRLAGNETVRQRVDFVAAGFSVVDAFADFCLARERLGRLARPPVNGAELATAAQAYAGARARFVEQDAAVRKAYPLALAPVNTALYLRNDPTARVLAARPANSLRMDAAGRAAFDRLSISGRELLADPRWSALDVRSPQRSADFDWTSSPVPWRGAGLPCAGRAIEFRRPTATLRLHGCKQETFSQWQPIAGGAWVLAQAHVRAKVSPGNGTYLIVSFLDAQQKHLGVGVVDRLPAGEGPQELELRVLAQAPAAARYVGFGLCTINQVGDDFAEFSLPSLKG